MKDKSPPSMKPGDIVKFNTSDYPRVGRILATIRAGDDALAALPIELQKEMGGYGRDILKGGFARFAPVDRVAILVSRETDKMWKSQKGKIFITSSGSIEEAA